MTENRFYKGKFKVEVLKKSKGNYLVKALEETEIPAGHGWSWTVRKNERFVTIPRLLWKKPRKR